MKKTRLHIGTAGWSYEDWKGIVYPEPRPRGFEELSFLSTLFNAVEVNSTFYRPTSAKMAEGWVKKTEWRGEFSFTAKLWQRFTHELSTPYSPNEVKLFRSGLAPLIEAGKLGGLLVQFPWSFRDSPAAREHLARVADDFSDVRLFLEVRHASWLTEDSSDLFRKLRLNFVNIDQPRSSSSIPPTDLVTGKAAYFRFHGRNAAKWFDKNASRDERYDYLYSKKELTPWAQKIRRLIGEVELIYTITNNHFRGQAAANALQLQKLLTGSSSPSPPSLVATFPFLQEG
ncbi:MAG: DUF72 domain-containing protein [Planctomycetota bacterium]